jgi:two-component system, LuxR family, response regulator FixJ
MKPAAQSKFAIALVDDDPAVLFALTSKLERHGMDIRGYSEAGSLLNHLSKGVKIDCVVADVRMPGLSGMDLLNTLANSRSNPPLILITGYPDIEVAIVAMKAGAHDFIVKPIDEARLVASIESAAIAARQGDFEKEQIAELAARVAELRDRHRQVLDLVVDGLTSKQIADRLGISSRTVENYRAAVMEHVGVGNIAQLVRMALQLKLPRNKRGPTTS